MNNNNDPKNLLKIALSNDAEIKALNIEPQHYFFCCEYIKDFKGSKAAERAQINVKHFATYASELLTRPNIIQAIQILVAREAQKIQDQTDVDVVWVLANLKEVAHRCMQAKPVMVRVDGKMKESGEYKFDSAGATRALELIGKHLAMFVDKKIVEHKLSWEDRVKEIRGDKPEQIRGKRKEIDVTPVAIKIDEDM